MNFLDPCSEEYNVHEFRNEVLKLLPRIWTKGKIPIIVGGTAYYLVMNFSNKLLFYYLLFLPSHKFRTRADNIFLQESVIYRNFLIDTSDKYCGWVYLNKISSSYNLTFKPISRRNCVLSIKLPMSCMYSFRRLIQNLLNVFTEITDPECLGF